MKYNIYKICCDDCDYVYVGSTKAFRERKAQHKRTCSNEKERNYNLKLYQTIRNNGGWDNWRMTPIEEYECENFTQARIREEYWRQEQKADLNMRKAFVSTTEYKKEYRQQNKDKIKEWNKDYKDKHKDELKEHYYKNRDKIAEQKKEYYELNQDKLKEYRDQNKDKKREYDKKYREQNEDKLKEYSKEKITCDCGCIVSRIHLARHQRTPKHIKLLN